MLLTCYMLLLKFHLSHYMTLALKIIIIYEYEYLTVFRKTCKLLPTLLNNCCVYSAYTHQIALGVSEIRKQVVEYGRTNCEIMM